MKLIGSYTSPFVRKISFSCWRKGLNLNSSMNSPTTPKTALRSTTRWEKSRRWSRTRVNAGLIPRLLRVHRAAGRCAGYAACDPKAALAVKQIEALADGIMDAANSVREQARPAAQQSETELLRQRKKSAAAWICGAAYPGGQDRLTA
jgi:hypothetical protein